MLIGAALVAGCQRNDGAVRLVIVSALGGRVAHVKRVGLDKRRRINAIVEERAVIVALCAGISLPHVFLAHVNAVVERIAFAEHIARLHPFVTPILADQRTAIRASKTPAVAAPALGAIALDFGGSAAIDVKTNVFLADRAGCEGAGYQVTGSTDRCVLNVAIAFRCVGITVGGAEIAAFSLGIGRLLRRTDCELRPDFDLFGKVGLCRYLDPRRLPEWHGKKVISMRGDVFVALLGDFQPLHDHLRCGRAAHIAEKPTEGNVNAGLV